MLNQSFCFKANLNKDHRFTENFLAGVLAISPFNLHKTTTMLSNSGEIMIYGKENAREYRIEDAYIILTRYRKKHQVDALNQFKKEFFS